jgi:hypothetical protein
MNKLIFAYILNDKNRLEEVRIDCKKNKFMFVKGKTFNLDTIESIDLIGSYIRDRSRITFYITTVLCTIFLSFFSTDFYSLISAIITSIGLGTLFAYTTKLFIVESKMYRIILNQMPYNLIISDLDVYDLKTYLVINQKKSDPFE